MSVSVVWSFNKFDRKFLDLMLNDDSVFQAVNVYLECLEERDLSLRQAGCAAIAALKVGKAEDL